jgi:hypothetical protein
LGFWLRLPSTLESRLTSVCVCLVSVSPLGPGFFRIVPTGLHFQYAFRGSLLGSFEPRRRPWGRSAYECRAFLPSSAPRRRPGCCLCRYKQGDPRCLRLFGAQLLRYRGPGVEFPLLFPELPRGDDERKKKGQGQKMEWYIKQGKRIGSNM